LRRSRRRDIGGLCVDHEIAGTELSGGQLTAGW
jgi:hypothetical protein